MIDLITNKRNNRGNSTNPSSEPVQQPVPAGKRRRRGSDDRTTFNQPAAPDGGTLWSATDYPSVIDPGDEAPTV